MALVLQQPRPSPTSANNVQPHCARSPAKTLWMHVTSYQANRRRKYDSVCPENAGPRRTADTAVTNIDQLLHQPGSEYAYLDPACRPNQLLIKANNLLIRFAGKLTVESVPRNKDIYIITEKERKKEGRKEERTKSNRSPCMPFVVSKSSMQKQIQFSPWFKVLQYSSKHSIICYALRFITLDQAQ